MTADPFSPEVPETDEPGRVRSFLGVLFIALVTTFFYQAMDGVQRANEQAERQARVAHTACRGYTLYDLAEYQANDAAGAVDGEDDTAATAQTVEAAGYDAPPTTAPVSPAALGAPADPGAPAQP